MAHDALSTRMKEYYEHRSRHYLTRRTPVIMRLDGKAFHTFTKGFRRPYDEILHNCMNETMKYFVVSDVHSFYTPLKKALDEKGFDADNESHCLIVCGDLFDRGPESLQLLKYIMSLPKKVLVRGNHEDLLEEMCKRGYAERHDISNGTLTTVCDLAPNTQTLANACTTALLVTEEYRSQLVNYFETKNYIFVHGWIPCEKYTGKTKPWYQWGKVYEYNPDWRNCNDVEWESARWINGISRAQDGVICPDKTIVCGHWHCSLGHLYDSDGALSEFGDDAKWEPWYHKGCIAIDRCTAHTGEVNVLVIDDEPLE